MTLKRLAFRFAYNACKRYLGNEGLLADQTELRASIASLLRQRWHEVVEDMYDAEDQQMQGQVLKQHCEMVALLACRQMKELVV